MSDVINGVSRELLERSAQMIQFYVEYLCATNSEESDIELAGECVDELRALLTAQPQASAAQSAPDEREADIRLMVDRFLSWPLPETLRADNCATMPGYPHRTGTNLMNADEAKQMLEHVISGANRHAEMESVELGMKLPCEVKLPGGMTIGKGCTLSTLLLAMRSRSDDEPWRQRFGVPVPFDPSLINLANSIKRQAKPNEQAEREAFEALRDCKGFDYFDGAYWLRAITEVPDEKALINADWELWQAATAWQRAQSAPDEREAFEAAVAAVNERGWTTSTDLARQIWDSCAAWQRAQSAPAGAVGWQFYQDGKWWNGDDRIRDHRANTEAAGYPVRDVYAAPQPAAHGAFGDPYQGAREDLAIWQRRALEAEEKVRHQDQIIDHLTLEAQGETRMGEPVIPAARQEQGE